ncbi:uncharacterized protein TM35_000291290 [Trypanosoma theileri]|uniref:Uncharacterized protein n=1 Tax=Trypanosoma theileri TaxID=67003 RepID=A0A1X0NNG5_9TRYP|nr:uncharacterized protein TM35_000291290 [Trypanosoma theileri]ORC86247.1 hypothetical protein TM35_000291290 [Trypanosoma theileri]
MSTLENCTDALLQQKAVQSSNYERLESRLMEMERTKRSLFFGLKEIITDVERRRQDLCELREETVRQQQQLQQSSVKFGALVTFIGSEQKKSLRLRDALESCATAWTGCPARVSLLLRALQERRVFMRQLSDVLIGLQRLRALVQVTRRVEAAKTLLQERMNEHVKMSERVEAAVQQQEKQQTERLQFLQACRIRLLSEGEELWHAAQQKEQWLLFIQSAYDRACLDHAAAEARNAIYRMALQEALTLTDRHGAVREHLALTARFTEWYSMQLREKRTMIEMYTHIIMDTLQAQEQHLITQKELAMEERKKTNSALLLSRETHVKICEAIAIHERRAEGLRLVHAAVRAFRRCQDQQRLHIHRERRAHESIMETARVAYEQRVAARRLFALQCEAREGLQAEETLTRGTIEEMEGDTREVMAQQQQQEEQEQLLHEQQKQQQQEKLISRRVVAEKKEETIGEALALITPKKGTTRRSHTEKKRPRSNTVLSSAAIRRTYPNLSQQQKEEVDEEEISPNSSVSSIGATKTFGTRLPLSALKKRTMKGSPLRTLPINVDMASNSGKKKDRRENKNHITGIKRTYTSSPLPRPPVNANSTCALSTALSSAFTRSNFNNTHTNTNTATAAAANPSAATVAGGLSKGRPLTRPRPSAVITKDVWCEGKADDIFADVFSF